ncbi:IQ motif-containing protein H isoform X2 [Nothobranchius furzeri]|uniref:IQ motif-containing protein H isoform X2 n=1 Tax=Nothobranchius furzeri TaxID=105023 RepID=UPI002403F05F|nr:IQ motif-containing protein H isoform X2 [Nothobranchius furzeri]
MSDTHENKDKLGADTFKHAEDYLKTVNKQPLVLPPIEDEQKHTIPIWNPLENFFEVHPQRKKIPGALPGKKVKHSGNVTAESVPLTKTKGVSSLPEDNKEKALQPGLLSLSVQHKSSSKTESSSLCNWREGGTEAVAIQSCWRRHRASTAVIAASWWKHLQMTHIKKALQARRLSHLENCRRRSQHLAANWKHIKLSKRTIIHIPSLGFSLSQRLHLRRFDILQNIQIGRIFDVRDENVEVIYICPLRLGEDVLQYYNSLLTCDETVEGADTSTTQASPGNRHFVILTPEAVDHFPTHNMCLSTLLKYSPRTLRRIKNLIQGKQAYIVGGVGHMDDLAVADELDVPILGPEPAVQQLYSTKSGGRRIFAAAKVDAPPGQGDIYSLAQLHEKLGELMTLNITVERWHFRMNQQRGDHVTAYCDVCHLSCYKWALQRYRYFGPDLWSSEWMQEFVLSRYLNEIPEWLAQYAQPAKTSSYPSWSCFLKTFLRQGGVVEACPPSQSVTHLTVDLLLEPGGEVTMLSCGDQLPGSCQLKAIGAIVPQTCVHPETLHSICMSVGQACLQHLIVGYVSVGLATFVDRHTAEQKVLGIDLDVAYSDQLAMTQMMLMTTGGTLNCHAGSLEVQMSIRKTSCAVKNPGASCFAVIGTHLFHSNLSMLYHRVFLQMCNHHGTGFNKEKKGTVFAFYDSHERCRIGMITVSEDLQGALVTFAQNLSFIHQEISPSAMEGENNFKELIKNIEDVLQIINQNKNQLDDETTA